MTIVLSIASSAVDQDQASAANAVAFASRSVQALRTFSTDSPHARIATATIIRRTVDRALGRRIA